MSTIAPPPTLFTIPVLVDSSTNLNNSTVLIPDGMIAKVAGSDQFKLGQGDKTWNELEFCLVGENGVGAQGPKGDTGPVGPTGPKGDTGPAGTIDTSTIMTLTGNQTVNGVKTFTNSLVVPIPTEVNTTSKNAAPVGYVVDQLRKEVEKMSDGHNTIVRDVNGNPNYMVVIPRFNVEDIFGVTTYGTGVHDMFKVGGKIVNEILIGKYLCSSINGKACSRPHANPWTNINFDQALAACRQLGTGFHLNTQASFAGRALQVASMFPADHQYHGNSNYGRCYWAHNETGTFASAINLNPGDTSLSADAVTLTGSGPITWNDDETAYGLADVAGNVCEWVAGYRLNEGEIQLIPENNAALSTTSFALTSGDWKAVLQNGTFVSPGTANTLKADGTKTGRTDGWYSNGNWRLNTKLDFPNNTGYCVSSFSTLTAATGVTVPGVLVRLGIMPSTQYKSINLCNWTSTCSKGEKVAFLGGAWFNYAPLLAYLNNSRSYSHRSVGFRLAFYSA